ncbi:MAG: hypothetical protein ACI87E_003805 [Mariniblastus sp.]|jgi:hypothetical protein
MPKQLRGAQKNAEFNSALASVWCLNAGDFGCSYYGSLIVALEEILVVDDLGQIPIVFTDFVQ